MKLTQSLLLILCLFLFHSAYADSTGIGEPSSANKIQPAENHSVWQTQGYGYILEVNGNDIRFYDITDHHCILNHSETGEYPSSNIRLIQGGAELEWGTIHPVKLNRLKALPTLCQQKLIPSIYDQNNKFSVIQMFDILWFTYAEHFAFNDKVNWDWSVNYPIWRKKISAQSSEELLAEVFKELLEELGDAHSYVETQEGRPIAGHNIKWENFRKNNILVPFKKQNKFSSPYEFHMDLNKRHADIITSYFIKDVKAQRLSGSFLFGQLPNALSYVSIDDMSGFTEEDTLSADLIAVDKAMNNILPMLNKSEGLIIDIRWNAGGLDAVSNRILSYLIDKPLYVGSKSAKLKKGFSQPRNIVIQPAKVKQYKGPIVVLTSGLTMSAGEVFLIGLAARENVTIIGEASNGGFSDSLPKQLPNGWTFALSNERYLDFENKSHEYNGYPVVQPYKYFNTRALKEKKDHALEAAMEILK